MPDLSQSLETYRTWLANLISQKARKRNLYLRDDATSDGSNTYFSADH